MTLPMFTPTITAVAARLGALCAAYSYTDAPGQALTAISAAADAVTNPDGLPPLWPTLAPTTSMDLVAELTSARATLLHDRAGADPAAAQALREAVDELDRALRHLTDDAMPTGPAGPSWAARPAGTPAAGGAGGAVG